MVDVIHLLPDSVANQIAAGEVVQRPASVVKELLDNAIDAKANRIQVIIEQAGITLIQVIDNGVGMSETDARMSFERHATSKIQNTKDLFQIRTKGFRGEALASIAAVAQVELKTKQNGRELGSRILIEGSKVHSQEICTCATGTSISVRNLFFNVPARRNFLKSATVEMRHIIDEFQRISLAFPDVSLQLLHNKKELYSIHKETQRQRIVSLLGKKVNAHLVPLEEKTELVSLSGFVGKAEFAKKTRGEQFFFVNNWFIKNSYLNHAVFSAYEGLIPNKHYPSYFIFFYIAPEKIDINIHPTKMEIKFEDEYAIYSILKSSVKRALGVFGVMPVIDFDRDQTIPRTFDKNKPVVSPTIKVNRNFNPFLQESRQMTNDKMKNLYEGVELVSNQLEVEAPNTQETLKLVQNESKFIQFHSSYLVGQVKSGLLFIDQNRAHQRILYERLKRKHSQSSGAGQQLLFSIQLHWNLNDIRMLQTIEDELKLLGFDLEFKGETVLIHRHPVDLESDQIENILSQLILEIGEIGEKQSDLQDRLLVSLSFNGALKKRHSLQQEEVDQLTQELFSCSSHHRTPKGKKIMETFRIEDIQKLFA